MIKYDDVELIPAAKEHFTQLAVWLNDMPKSRLGPASKRPLDMEQVQEWAESTDIEAVKVFVVNCERQLVGMASIGSLSWRNRQARIFTFIDPIVDMPTEIEGKAIKALVGYAFGELGMNKVSVEMLAGDVYLTNLYERAGFRPEVRKRQHYFAEGKYHHVLELAALAVENNNERNLSGPIRKE